MRLLLLLWTATVLASQLDKPKVSSPRGAPPAQHVQVTLCCPPHHVFGPDPAWRPPKCAEPTEHVSA